MQLSQPASGLEGLCMREKAIVSLKNLGSLSAAFILEICFSVPGGSGVVPCCRLVTVCTCEVEPPNRLQASSKTSQYLAESYKPSARPGCSEMNCL